MSSAVDSILRLHDFRVMKSYFEVNPEAKSFDKTQTHLSLEVSLLQSNEAENDMAVQLEVGLNQEDEEFEASGFTGSIIVTGFFDVSSLREERPDDWEPALVFNGVTVLFGIVRNSYAELSAASPVGRVIVPTINAAGFIREDAAEVEAAEAQTN